MNDIYLSVVRLAVNLFVCVRAFRRAWQLRNDQRDLARSTKMYLMGMAGYNLSAAIVFFVTAVTGSFFLLGIQAGWWYTAANGLEVIPFLVLDFILDRTPKQDLLNSTEMQLAISLNDLRKIRDNRIYSSFPKEVKVLVDNAEDTLGNLVTQLSLRRQVSESGLQDGDDV